MMKKTIEIEQKFKGEVLQSETVVLGDFKIIRHIDTRRNKTLHIEVKLNGDLRNEDDFEKVPVKLGKMYVSNWLGLNGFEEDYININYLREKEYDQTEEYDVYLKENGDVTLIKRIETNEITISDVKIEQVAQALEVVKAVKTMKSVF
ncbi:MAG TPA: hypothetical protein PKY82_00635 [Pyrinomonadaceae bacterium]|nr:hypothetical protein [Pyrinomonadaceae bacterium]